MPMWSSSGARNDTSVACPECGRLFSRRGLAAHRRMRHGPGSPPETVVAAELPGPLPALPRVDDNAAIARALEAVAIAVTRLEARLDQVLAAGRAAPAPAPASVPTVTAPQARAVTDKLALERELCTLLAEIARVRAECASATGDERPAVDAQAHARLGKLRRRQASILARLLQLDGDPGGDEMCFL
jgi:hypothetical protein